ncbi:hypothetical protein BGZ91_003408 [Linnemannia elongata]|nr:hypothetical protein BGZ91_003408 [Linnemannia elongata]
MSNYHLTLFCLVDGEATSNAFPVSASAKTTVGELKDSIKSKKTIDFSDIDADKLILWRVSIPITDEDDEVPIILNSFDKRKLGPVTRLSKVFPEDLPEETIHIIVQRPPPDRVSEYDYVQCVPSPIIGHQQLPSPTTRSGHPSVSIKPSSVGLWTDFMDCVRTTELKRAPQYPRPKFRDDRIFLQEATLHELFAQDFGVVQLLPPGARTIKIMGLMRGNPDLVCMRAQGGFDVPAAVLFPIEMKRPIRLRVFPKTRTRTRAGNVSRATLVRLDNLELISGDDESAQTYRASWKESDVVLKKCDIWNQHPVVEELEHEARVYQVLQKLQGYIIPKLRLSGVSDGMEMILVTDFIGVDISHERLDCSDKKKIREALSAIHSFGVLHADIRPQNILVKRDGPVRRFFFIDFGLSQFTTDKEKLQQEADILGPRLGW